MDGSGLLTVDRLRQEQVDGVLDRLFSLTKNRAAASGPECGTHPFAVAVLGRVT
jgi:geranylgeranyl diphosphate synthase type II